MGPVILFTQHGFQPSSLRKDETVKAESGQNLPQEGQRRLTLMIKSPCLTLMVLLLPVVRKLMTKAGFLCNTYNGQKPRDPKVVIQSRGVNGHYQMFMLISLNYAKTELFESKKFLNKIRKGSMRILILYNLKYHKMLLSLSYLNN